MTRSGPGLKFDGAPCKKCGSTLRYVSTRQCVSCCNSRDRTGTRKRTQEYQQRIRASHYRAGADESSAILWALSKDAPAAVSRQAKMYLGVPKYQQELAQPAPMTAGDVWRSMLPVGASKHAPQPNMYNKEQPTRHAENRELAAAVAALLPALPDVIGTDDIIERLDPELVAKLKTRMSFALGRAFRACGAVRLRMSEARKALYLVRQAGAYERMSWKAIIAHHADKTFTRPGDAQPVGERRARGGARRGGGRPRKAADPAERRRERAAYRQRAYRARKAAKGAVVNDSPMVNGASTGSNSGPDRGLRPTGGEAHHGRSVAV